MPETIPRMHAIRDSDAAFGAAIARGVLSEDRSHERFAGWYMYMFHDTAGAAWFKHRETRQYVTMEPATCNGAAPGNGAAPDSKAAPGSKAAPCDADGPCNGAETVNECATGSGSASGTESTASEGGAR